MTESHPTSAASEKPTEEEAARALWTMSGVFFAAFCCLLLWQAFAYRSNKLFVESAVLMSEGQSDACMKTGIASRLTQDSANRPITHGEMGDMRQRCRDAAEDQEISRVADAARKEQQNALSTLAELK